MGWKSAPKRIQREVGDIPSHIVRIVYQGRALDEVKRKKKDEELKAYTRYLYVYEKIETLDERMSKAWRQDASAVIYSVKATQERKLTATETRGVWS